MKLNLWGVVCITVLPWYFWFLFLLFVTFQFLNVSVKLTTCIFLLCVFHSVQKCLQMEAESCLGSPVLYQLIEVSFFAFYFCYSYYFINACIELMHLDDLYWSPVIFLTSSPLFSSLRKQKRSWQKAIFPMETVSFVFMGLRYVVGVNTVVDIVHAVKILNICYLFYHLSKMEDITWGIRFRISINS